MSGWIMEFCCEDYVKTSGWWGDKIAVICICWRERYRMKDKKPYIFSDSLHYGNSSAIRCVLECASCLMCLVSVLGANRFMAIRATIHGIWFLFSHLERMSVHSGCVITEREKEVSRWPLWVCVLPWATPTVQYKLQPVCVWVECDSFLSFCWSTLGHQLLPAGGILAGHFLSLFSVDFMVPSVSCFPWLALEAAMWLLLDPLGFQGWGSMLAFHTAWLR